MIRLGNYKTVLALLVAAMFVVLSAVPDTFARHRRRTHRVYYSQTHAPYHHHHSRRKGAVVGGLIGAGAGAIVGGGKGALIGAGAGAGTGYIVQRHRNRRHGTD